MAASVANDLYQYLFGGLSSYLGSPVILGFFFLFGWFFFASVVGLDFITALIGSATIVVVLSAATLGGLGGFLSANYLGIVIFIIGAVLFVAWLNTIRR